MKYFNKDRIKTNAESLIGKQAVVTEDIDNLLAVGLVSINGQEWTARNVVDGMKIPKGTVVIAVSYTHLDVYKRQREHHGAGGSGEACTQDRHGNLRL